MRKAPVCELLNKAETEELLKCYTTPHRGWWQAGEEKFVQPYAYQKNAASIFNLRLRKSDKWIITFPRSGTTWIQELIWLLNNNLDYEKALTTMVDDRVFFIENTFIGESLDNTDHLPKRTNNHDLRSNVIDSMPSPRFIKTHFPFQLLPPNLLDVGCKVAYVARNPKDVLLSMFIVKNYNAICSFSEDLPTYWKFFRRNLELCCPYFAHVKKAWSLRNNPNLLFLFYEELKMDLPGVIRKAAQFYGRSCTKEEIEKLVEHLDIKNFKKNPMIGSHYDGVPHIEKDVFVRKGQIGGWKEVFTPEMNAEIDEWIAENLRDSDLVFPYVEATWKKTI